MFHEAWDELGRFLLTYYVGWGLYFVLRRMIIRWREKRRAK